jgi:hypothetical protein
MFSTISSLYNLFSFTFITSLYCITTALPHSIFKGVSSPARNTNERFCHVGRKKKDWYEDDEQSSTLDRYSSYRIVLIECDSEVIIGDVEL